MRQIAGARIAPWSGTNGTTSMETVPNSNLHREALLSVTRCANKLCRSSLPMVTSSVSLCCPTNAGLDSRGLGVTMLTCGDAMKRGGADGLARVTTCGAAKGPLITWIRLTPGQRSSFIISSEPPIALIVEV